MNLLTDPNIAYVLMVLGIMLGVLALFAPGTGLLEIGALFVLVLAGVSASNMDINPWALAILILGVVPFIFALRKWRNWIFLGVTILAVVVGSYFLFRSPDGSPAVNLGLAVFVSLLVTAILWVIGRKSLEAIARRPDIDLSKLDGMVGETHTSVFHEGSVYINGEDWSAWSEKPIPANTRVKVVSRQGLVLEVEPVDELNQIPE